MQIGFVGLGKMGAAMARNLLFGGHEILVHNRSAEKAMPLVEAGATLAETVAQACQSDVVFTMLANDEAAEAVVLAEDGILASLPRGSMHISSSTISVSLSGRLSNLHRRAGQPYLAAPVFGHPEAAAAAELFVVAAGDEDAYRDARPLLETIGKRSFYAGRQAEAANAIKLCGDFFICSVMEALGESMTLADKSGISPALYLEILTSGVFDVPIYRTYSTLIADQDFRPARFAAPLGAKDMSLLLEAARHVRVPMPLASLLHDRLLTVLATEGDVDWSALGGVAFEDAGITASSRETAGAPA